MCLTVCLMCNHMSMLNLCLLKKLVFAFVVTGLQAKVAHVRFILLICNSDFSKQCELHKLHNYVIECFSILTWATLAPKSGDFYITLDLDISVFMLD